MIPSGNSKNKIKKHTRNQKEDLGIIDEYIIGILEIITRTSRTTRTKRSKELEKAYPANRKAKQP